MSETREQVEKISDGDLFEEVAERLKKAYRLQHGIEFLYGCFEFLFHEGRFQGIEDRPRYKRYRSPRRLMPIQRRIGEVSHDEA